MPELFAAGKQPQVVVGQLPHQSKGMFYQNHHHQLKGTDESSLSSAYYSLASYQDQASIGGSPKKMVHSGMVVVPKQHLAAAASALPVKPLHVYLEETKALQDAMSFVADSSAYKEALRVCPDLVQVESPAARFLSFTRQNVWEAAQRMAAYWESRIEAFGREAAFLPLAQALSPQAKEFLLHGSVAITPRDNLGRAVTFVDHTRWWREEEGQQRVDIKKVFALQHRKQVYFYMMQVNSQLNSEAVYIMRTDVSNAFNFDREVFEFGDKILSQASCQRFRQLHFVFADCTKGAKRALLGAIAPLVIKVFDEWMPNVPTMAAHMGSTEEVCASLLGYGLPPSALPKSCGGKWTYEKDWRKFLEARNIDFSGCIPDASPKKVADDKRRPPRPTRPTSASTVSSESVASAQQQQMSKEEARKIRRRQQNVIYSRKKRLKKKQRECDLKQQEEELLTENDRLKREEERLAGLLAQATELVGGAAPHKQLLSSSSFSALERRKPTARKAPPSSSKASARPAKRKITTKKKMTTAQENSKGPSSFPAAQWHLQAATPPEPALQARMLLQERAADSQTKQIVLTNSSLASPPTNARIPSGEATDLTTQAAPFSRDPLVDSAALLTRIGAHPATAPPHLKIGAPLTVKKAARELNRSNSDFDGRHRRVASRASHHGMRRS